MSRVKNTKLSVGDVQLEVPSGYAVKMMLLTTAPETTEPDGLPFARNVMVSREALAGELTAAELCQRQLQQCARGMQSFEHVSTTQVQIEGKSCPLAEIRGIGPGGLTYTSLLAFCVSDTHAFTLSASNREGAAFEQTRAELLAVIKSFRTRKEPS